MSDIVPLKQLNDVYAREALDQLPRLLSMIDRNAYSQTFGCGDRMFWLDKAIDFPSSIYQYGVHALALVYTYSYVNNPFYRQPKIRDWAFAMMRYWQKIQNKDGSFDEFYPNEHGWAGPTGFLLHAMMGSFELLSDEMDPEFKKSFLATCRNAAIFLSTYDEHGILANHHAMALLPIYHYSHVTGDRTVLSNFGAKLDFFLSLQSKEGWYLEYDGADMGYLSASISFMSKLSHFMTGIEVDKAWKEKIDSSIEKAIEFAKYFVYPNGYYGGTMGSRQTLHFYPHGFEQWAGKNPVAARMAEFMRMGLEKGSLVSPRIMPGRYLAYRINEFLVSSIDCHNVRSTVKLPWEEKPFTRFFPEAGIWIRNGPHFYALINFSKGGVIKVFSKPSGKLTINDCGIRLLDEKGNQGSSQWIDPKSQKTVDTSILHAKGRIHRIVNELPTPSKMIVLRSILLTIGSNTSAAYRIKGKIRERIILKNKPLSIPYSRKIHFEDNVCEIIDTLNTVDFHSSIMRLTLGDEFSVRYVPQSLYFQEPELESHAFECPHGILEKLNREKKISISRQYNIQTGRLIEASHD